MTKTTTLETTKRAIYLLTNRIETTLGDALKRTKTGVVVVSVCGNDGAKCGLTVNEGADPDVRTDMLRAFDAMVRDPVERQTRRFETPSARRSSGNRS